VILTGSLYGGSAFAVSGEVSGEPAVASEEGNGAAGLKAGKSVRSRLEL
jgi:hypothetical protein